MRGLTEERLNNFTKQRDELTAAAKVAQTRYDKVYADIKRCPEEAYKMLGTPADDAVTALFDTAQHVECLYDLSNNISKARLKGLAARHAYVDTEVKACRQSAQALAAAFKNVATNCHEQSQAKFAEARLPRRADTRD